MSKTITSPITDVPQHKLRRLAERLLRVLERHASKHKAIASLEPRLTAVATAYILAFDKVRTSGPTRAKELREGHDHAHQLLTIMRRWTGVLIVDVEAFDSKAFAAHPSMPDDVLGAADRMITLVTDYVGGDGQPLPYKDELLSELSAALETARKEWVQGQAIKAELQEAQSELRTLAGELQTGLVALRRTLRAVLGSKHVDYQKLRLARATQMDEEDPEVVDGMAEPGDPAPLEPVSDEGEEDAAE